MHAFARSVEAVRVCLAPVKKRHRTSTEKPGRLWIRCTAEEWDQFEEVARQENTSAQLWILNVLRREADTQRAMGHYVEQRPYRLSRRVPGVALRDTNQAGNHNIYCRLQDQTELQEVASYFGKSFNLWAMEILRHELMQTRRKWNMVLAQPEVQKLMAAEIRSGHMPEEIRKAIREFIKKHGN